MFKIEETFFSQELPRAFIFFIFPDSLTHSSPIYWIESDRDTCVKLCCLRKPVGSQLTTLIFQQYEPLFYYILTSLYCSGLLLSPFFLQDLSIFPFFPRSAGMLSCSGHVCFFVMLWTVAVQTLLSIAFSTQEYWNRLPSPSPRDLQDPGIKHASLTSPVLSGTFFTTSTT